MFIFSEIWTENVYFLNDLKKMLFFSKSVTNHHFSGNVDIFGHIYQFLFFQRDLKQSTFSLDFYIFEERSKTIFQSDLKKISVSSKFDVFGDNGKELFLKRMSFFSKC